MGFLATTARLEALASDIAERLDRNKVAFLAAISIIHYIVTIACARAEPFWFDELFTYYVSLQPSLHGLWAAATAPIDQQPPLFFLLTRAANSLVRDPHIGLRLPGMFGFWLLSMCLFLFTSRRSTALWGTLAMVVLYLTPAYKYAYEARPYGLVVGFAALALYSWQSAASGRWRAVSLVGLAIAIAAAISSSYYAVLIVAPLAIGEIARSIKKRSIDRAVWVALTCGSAVALAYLPLVTRYVKSFAKENWAAPERTTIVQLFKNMLENSSLALVLVVLIAGVRLLWPQSDSEPASEAPEQPPSYEVIAALGFVLLPCLGVLVAVLVTKMITFRYVLSAVIGFSVLVAWAARTRARSSALVALVVVCGVAGSAFVGQAISFKRDVVKRRSATTNLRRLLAGQPAGLPVVVDDPLKCLELCHYEKADITSRLIYLVDPEASLRFATQPYLEATDWLMMVNFMPVRAERVASFRARTRQFLIYSTGSELGYVLAQMSADGARIQLLSVGNEESLFLVDDTR